MERPHRMNSYRQSTPRPRKCKPLTRTDMTELRADWNCSCSSLICESSELRQKSSKGRAASVTCVVSGEYECEVKECLASTKTDKEQRSYAEQGETNTHLPVWWWIPC